METNVDSNLKTDRTVAALTTEMKAIVETDQAIVEVLAGAGTGKTFVIEKRIEWLLAHGASQTDILCLTFSNYACSVLRDRLDARGFKSVQVKTIHAFCLGLAVEARRVLRKGAGTEVGKGKGRGKGNGKVQVLGEAEALLLVADARNSAIDGLHDAGSAISSAASEREWLESMDSPEGDQLILGYLKRAEASKQPFDSLLSADGVEDTHAPGLALERIAAAYQAAKAALGSMDFGDMIRVARDGLNGGTLRPGYTHVIVDEYQDSSADQALLLHDLHACVPHLMVLGDAHQAVYGFGGATYTPLRKLFKKGRLFKLTQSFRLNQATADLAMSVLLCDGTRLELKAGAHGSAPVLVINDDQDQQALEVARDIASELSRGASALDFVVMARTRAALAPTRAALLAQGIPSGEGGVIASAIHARRVAWMIDTVDQRARDGQTITAAELESRFESINADQDTWDRAAKELAQVNAPSTEGRYEQCTKVYLGLFGGTRRNHDLLAELRYWRPLAQTIPSGRALYEKVLQICQTAPVLATTIHGAKGGEWANVAVVGVTEGVLPIYLAQMPVKVAEERRLLYVAITRARNRLRLYHAPVHHARSRQLFADVSSLLRPALDKKLLKVEKGFFSDPKSSRKKRAPKPAPTGQLPLPLGDAN